MEGEKVCSGNLGKLASRLRRLRSTIVNVNEALTQVVTVQAALEHGKVEGSESERPGVISDLLAKAVEGIDQQLQAEPERYPNPLRQHILRVRAEINVLQTRLDAPPAALELDRLQQEVIDTYRARRSSLSKKPHLPVPLRMLRRPGDRRWAPLRAR